MLTLAIWVWAVAILVSVDRAERFLWVPVVLAVAGMFSSILPLALSLKAAVVANGIILTLFMVSLEVLNPKHRQNIAAIRPRGR